MPYLHVPPIQLGPVTIQFFGITAALAVVLGVKAMRYRAAELDLDVSLLDRLMLWLFVGVVLGAHLISVFLYYPDKIVQDPLILIRLWDGISSFGGITGGAIAAILYFRRLGVKMRHYKQALLFGAIVCLLVGRFGCAVAHDHPGKQTTAAMAVKGWPTQDTPERDFGFHTKGPRRHDLGFYEFLFLIPVAGILYFLRCVRPFENFHVVLVLFLYTPFRFAVDFLRAFDKRYFGLTPGQYFAVAFFILAVFLACQGLFRLRARAPSQAVT